MCGDGRNIQGDEDCDDGNTIDGDGCSHECVVEPRVLATWTIQSYDGTLGGCPGGYDVAVIQTSNYAATYPCSDGRGIGKQPARDTHTLTNARRTTSDIARSTPRGSTGG